MANQHCKFPMSDDVVSEYGSAGRTNKTYQKDVPLIGNPKNVFSDSLRRVVARS